MSAVGCLLVNHRGSRLDGAILRYYTLSITRYSLLITHYRLTRLTSAAAASMAPALLLTTYFSLFTTSTL